MELKKPILIKLEVEMVVDVPADWNSDDIEFFLNESSHCLSNEIEQLHEECNRTPGVCNLCSRAKATYLRDAVETDFR